jgi:hypothetical protein
MSAGHGIGQIRGPLGLPVTGELIGPEPPRLTPTQRLHEVTMAALSRTPSMPEHSCELTRNAKGATQISLTVRGFGPREVVDRAVELYDFLRARYPLPSGYVGAEGEPAEPKSGK